MLYLDVNDSFIEMIEASEHVLTFIASMAMISRMTSSYTRSVDEITLVSIKVVPTCFITVMSLLTNGAC